jgi:hypothetical protein
LVRRLVRYVFKYLAGVLTDIWSEPGEFLTLFVFVESPCPAKVGVAIEIFDCVPPSDRRF